jgi:hypothetical protein
MYFTRTQETFTSLGGPLQGPIARNLLDGGSAALEGLVRAIEVSSFINYILYRYIYILNLLQHLDLIEELEPHSLNSSKHIFFITSSPPDSSKRPLWNNCEKFDDFGWKQCEEWLQQVSLQSAVR